MPPPRRQAQDWAAADVPSDQQCEAVVTVDVNTDEWRVTHVIVYALRMIDDTLHLRLLSYFQAWTYVTF